MSRRQPSLKARLIVKQLVLQFLTVAFAAIVFVLLIVHTAVDGMYADEALARVAAEAIRRDAGGAPTVVLTPDLARLRKASPDLWFEARLQDGRHIAFGRVPREFASLVAHLDRFSSADMRDRSAPYALSAIVRQMKGPAGEMAIISHGRVRPFSTLIAMASNLVAIPVFLVLALASVVATPWIVRRTLAGVLRTAKEAERIDVDRRGIRLSEAEVPREIGPLVRAVNDALGRLDEGYERQHRFIASAAHELRTPIAILRMKIDTASEPGVRALAADLSRLTTLSEQLLDLHRLDNGAPGDRIDLAGLARRVAADLAPILIASGKSIEVLVDRPAPILGNAGAIERVLTNLVQNAVEHGGEQVLVRVERTSIEVEDDGPGIPAEERDRVFEPFHRLRPRPSGTGLGLNLVRQVMDHHHGRVTIAGAPGGGTIVRVEFPTIA
jgi:two-component system, OmpR family, sensor histidine kinase TctE